MRLWPALMCTALLVPSLAIAQAGNAQAGKAYWEGNGSLCRNCHGQNGEGGFGPDLAGRRLTLAQFARAVRAPWSIMPAFPPPLVTDAEMADMVAYFDSLPPVAQPGAWRVTVPQNAPAGQVLHIATVGCGQCHGEFLLPMRAATGSVNGDYEWFKALVYNHAVEEPKHFARLEVQNPPRVRMGNYSRVRLPEPMLAGIWRFLQDLGPRVPVAGQVGSGVPGPTGVTYTLNVTNNGLVGQGLTAEDLTVMLVVPAGATVVTTTGAGYQGVRTDDAAKATVAVWQLPRLAPRDRHAYTITISRAGTPQDNVRGVIRWSKPAVKPGPVDQAVIAPAPLAP